VSSDTVTVAGATLTGVTITGGTPTNGTCAASVSGAVQATSYLETTNGKTVGATIVGNSYTAVGIVNAIAHNYTGMTGCNADDAGACVWDGSDSSTIVCMPGSVYCVAISGSDVVYTGG
jgi:hypothetical protein